MINDLRHKLEVVNEYMKADPITASEIEIWSNEHHNFRHVLWSWIMPVIAQISCEVSVDIWLYGALEVNGTFICVSQNKPILETTSPKCTPELFLETAYGYITAKNINNASLTTPNQNTQPQS